MSQVFAPVEKTPEQIARLNLRAVLPTFRDLLEQSEEARDVLGKQRFLLRICCADLQIDLLFNKSRCRASYKTHAQPTISLRFLSHQQLNRSFSGDGFALPIPTRGIHRIGILRTVTKLSHLLQKYLLDPGEVGSTQRSLHLHLSLQVALAGAAELIAQEPFSSSLFEGSGDWTAGFIVKGTNYQSWIGRRGKNIYLWRHPPPHPFACLEFSNSEIAYQSLNGATDALSTIHEGKIKVTGKLPLIERLSLVFERVSLYLQPSPFS